MYVDATCVLKNQGKIPFVHRCLAMEYYVEIGAVIPSGCASLKPPICSDEVKMQELVIPLPTLLLLPSSLENFLKQFPGEIQHFNTHGNETTLHIEIKYDKTYDDKLGMLF